MGAESQFVWMLLAVMTWCSKNHVCSGDTQLGVKVEMKGNLTVQKFGTLKDGKAQYFEAPTRKREAF